MFGKLPGQEKNFRRIVSISCKSNFLFKVSPPSLDFDIFNIHAINAEPLIPSVFSIPSFIIYVVGRPVPCLHYIYHSLM